MSDTGEYLSFGWKQFEFEKKKILGILNKILTISPKNQEFCVKLTFFCNFI